MDLLGPFQTGKQVESETLTARDVAAAFQDSKHSDLTLAYNGKTWKVHKMVLCQRSTVIERQCDGPFSEATSAKISIGIDSVSTEAVQRMLDYLYGENLDNGPTTKEHKNFEKTLPRAKAITECQQTTQDDPQNGDNAAEEVDDDDDWAAVAAQKRAKGPSILNAAGIEQGCKLINNVQVYALADYYDIGDLKDAAMRKFASALESDVVPAFAIISRLVYDCMPDKDNLRSLTARFAAQHRHRLGKDKSFLEVMTHQPDLLIEYTQASTDYYEQEMSSLGQKLADANGDKQNLLADNKELQMWREDADNMVAEFNYHQRCKECRFFIDVNIEILDSSKGWVVSCGKCNADFYR